MLSGLSCALSCGTLHLCEAMERPPVRHKADAAHLGEQLSMQPRPFKESYCIPTSQPSVRVCKIIGACYLGGT